MTRKELIAALEKAPGPDWKLDEAIWRHLGYWWDHGEAQWCAPHSAIAAEGDKSPSFTASIDAALTLVPEGCEWVLQTDGSGTYAHVDGPDGVMYQAVLLCRHQFALALCIAALKARA